MKKTPARAGKGKDEPLETVAASISAVELKKEMDVMRREVAELKKTVAELATLKQLREEVKLKDQAVAMLEEKIHEQCPKRGCQQSSQGSCIS